MNLRLRGLTATGLASRFASSHFDEVVWCKWSQKISVVECEVVIDVDMKSSRCVFWFTRDGGRKEGVGADGIK